MPFELGCPICGGEMELNEATGLYWKCSACDYTRNANQQYPKDGVIRCDCGGEYAFSMKTQPRWVCKNNPKHYQKMREGDLMLGKMAALIPTMKAKREVEQYFAQQHKRGAM